MFKRLFAAAVLGGAALMMLHEVRAQELKSGPQRPDALPGSFQPLNLNGQFYKDRHHCLVCQFGVHPVALVFVNLQGVEVNPEVEKLLQALEKDCNEHFADFGLSSFVVFLSSAARSSVSEGTGKGDYNKETQLREKLIVSLQKRAAEYKRVIWTIYPPDNISATYKLSDKAEVTVILYARHRVLYNFAFAEGELKDEGVQRVQKGVLDMLEELKKGAPKTK